MIGTFLENLGLGHHIAPLLDYGVESLTDVELLAVRMPLRYCADMLRATGVTPREWTTIRRAYLALQEWCQPSYLEDRLREMTLDLLLADSHDSVSPK